MLQIGAVERQEGGEPKRALEKEFDVADLSARVV
jgi:hypothetical protein